MSRCIACAAAWDSPASMCDNFVLNDFLEDAFGSAYACTFQPLPFRCPLSNIQNTTKPGSTNGTKILLSCINVVISHSLLTLNDTSDSSNLPRMRQAGLAREVDTDDTTPSH